MTYVESDRDRWNARWRERAAHLEDASPFVVENASLFGHEGTSIDLAGGAGRNSIWLARRGYHATVVDISDVALDRAEERARRQGVLDRMRLLRLDLDGPLSLAHSFDLLVVVHYLDRARRGSFVDLVVEGGLVVVANPTVKNLERHARPGRDYLVELGELGAWAGALGLDVLAEREDWTGEGMHEAAVIARKRMRAVAVDLHGHEAAPSNGPYR